MESTATLLEKIREGDVQAQDRLVRRYLPRLQRWASGRLPDRARDLFDTNDLVQVTLLKALERIGSFEPRREGAFLFYLRKALLNQIRDLLRRADRRPGRAELDSNLADGGTSPLEHAIRADVLERYEAALRKLPDVQREAVVLRIEMGFTHREVAEAVGSPSADAARMLVTRALVQLAEEMAEVADGAR